MIAVLLTALIISVCLNIILLAAANHWCGEACSSGAQNKRLQIELDIAKRYAQISDWSE